MPEKIKGPILTLIIVTVGVVGLAILSGCQTTAPTPPKSFQQICSEGGGELYSGTQGELVCIYADGKVVREQKN